MSDKTSLGYIPRAFPTALPLAWFSSVGIIPATLKHISMMEYLGTNSLGQTSTRETVITGQNMSNPPDLPAIYENP